MPPKPSSFTGSFSTTEANHEVACPLPNNDGSKCHKKCTGVSTLIPNTLFRKFSLWASADFWRPHRRSDTAQSKNIFDAPIQITISSSQRQKKASWRWSTVNRPKYHGLSLLLPSHLLELHVSDSSKKTCKISELMVQLMVTKEKVTALGSSSMRRDPAKIYHQAQQRQQQWHWRICVKGGIGTLMYSTRPALCGL